MLEGVLDPLNRPGSKTLTAVFFDHSGTLANDLMQTLDTVNHILGIYDKPPMTLQEFRGIFSLPYWNIFEGFGLPRQTAKVECLKLYQKLIQKHSQKIKPFADVEPTLKILSENKILGIVSTTPRTTIESFLARSNLDRYFSKIVSLEDSVEQKPSPLPLLIACEQIGSKLYETAYVGDQYEDILAAKNARMISVAISRKYSYHTYPKLISARPDFLIPNIRELANLEVIRC